MNNTESGRIKNDKKIVLAALNASFVHSNPALYALRRSAYAYLEKNGETQNPEGLHIELAEYTVNDRYEDILFDLIGREAGMIGLSVYIWNAQLSLQLLADLRKLYPPETGLILFAGGPEAETRPGQYLENCDFVMAGQGEYTFSRICERKRNAAVSSPEDLWRDLPGIIYRENNAVRSIPPAQENDRRFEKELPFLYDGTENFEHRIVYYESSRGCPFRCIYCLSSEETGMVFRDADTVKKELQFFLDKKTALVKFVDRTFNASASRARGIWNYIKEKDNGVTGFHFEIGADLLAEEDLLLLKSLRPGLVQLEIGIQSTNPDTLKAIRRGADNKKIFHAVRELLGNQNIALHTDLIAGLPYEDLPSFQRSFDEVYSLHAHQFQVGFLKVLSGTEMAGKASEYGIVSSARPPYTVLSTKWLSPAEIDRIRKIADMVEMFWNSGLFRHALPYLENLFDSPFALYEALAVYYREQKGNGALSPRLRGAFLEQFAERERKASAFDSAYFKELLRFDERLHFHPSRRMTACDTFHLTGGKCVRAEFDYSVKHPVTKEAAYRICVEDGGTEHE